jgi:adenylate cyclase
VAGIRAGVERWPLPELPDFEAEGLLARVEPAGVPAREKLLAWLVGEGVDLEELKREAEVDRLALVPANLVFGFAGDRYTPREIAEKTDLAVEDFLRLVASLGFPRPDLDQRTFDDADLAAAARLRRLELAGVPIEKLLEVSRVIGSAAARIADAHREIAGSGLVDPEADEFEAAMALRGAAEDLLPLGEQGVTYALRLHFADQMRNEVVAATEPGSFGRAKPTEVSICFADLVGFTRLGERSEIERIGSVAKLLESVAIDVTNPEVRLVKLIGDAAMLVSKDGAALMDAALRFVEAGKDAGDELPALKVGVARGDAIPQGGDWFGHTVNLASRITAVARPDSVLAEASAVEAAGDGFALSSAGEHRFKGLSRPVRLYRVRRPVDSFTRDGASRDQPDA